MLKKGHLIILLLLLWILTPPFVSVIVVFLILGERIIKANTGGIKADTPLATTNPVRVLNKTIVHIVFYCLCGIIIYMAFTLSIILLMPAKLTVIDIIPRLWVANGIILTLSIVQIARYISIRRKVVCVQYNPPSDLSPAEARWLLKPYSLDSCVFMIGLMSLLSKNYIKITIPEDVSPKTYDNCDIEKNNGNAPLFPDEKVMLDNLFFYQNKVNIWRDAEQLRKTCRIFCRRVQSDVQSKYFLGKNFISGKVIGISFLVAVLNLIIIPYFLYQAGISLDDIGGASWLLILFYAIMPFILSIDFTFTMQFSTKTKELITHLNGFKLYLELVESRRLDTVQDLDKTYANDIKLLPWAFALGVENSFLKEFSYCVLHLSLQETSDESMNNFVATINDRLTSELSTEINDKCLT